MRVLVVGTGSIGRRHISNLLDLGVRVAAYSYRGWNSPSRELDGRVERVVHWSDALADNLDAVIIANSTELHLEVALEAANRGKHLFIEKPLSVSLAGTAHLARLIQAKHLVAEAGFMLRTHPNLVWIKEYLSGGMLGELMYLRASVGQWLPDWRPGTDHRSGYGAFREKGGGVIFDLIHELDLMNWLGGRVVDATAMTHYVPLLGIQTESIAQIGLRLDSGALAQVHLDYVRPGYGRSMEIVGHKGVLSWDYSQGTVSLSKPDGMVHVVHRTPPCFERNSMFLTHMVHFLNRISDLTMPALSPFQDSVEALRLALACHRSAAERRNIRPQEIDSNFEVKEHSA